MDTDRDELIQISKRDYVSLKHLLGYEYMYKELQKKYPAAASAFARFCKETANYNLNDELEKYGPIKPFLKIISSFNLVQHEGFREDGERIYSIDRETKLVVSKFTVMSGSGRYNFIFQHKKN